MTTDSIAYDPRTKKRIKDALYEFLYGPVQIQMDKTLKGLIIKNSLIFRNGQTVFTYKGETYTYTPGEKYPRPMNRLDKSLHNEMDVYLDELTRLNTEEIPYVVNYIKQVLNSSDSFADYYRLLPDSVHHPIKELEKGCPCRSVTLTPDMAAVIQQKNTKPIELMRNRMVYNLLLV